MTLDQGDPADLTPEDAARLLGLSRPAVLRLIAQGTLRSRLVAGERRLRAAELLAWREGRRETLAALSRLSEAHDL